GGVDGSQYSEGNINPRLKASAIAQNAAQVAKAANEAQADAAHDAAQKVKIQLAEKAYQAANAAEAVLEGKEAIVANFEREIREANAVVNQVTNSLDGTESNADTAVIAAKAAEAQLSDLKCLVQDAGLSLNDVESLVEQAQSEMEEKAQMLAAAKTRAHRLTRQLAQAKEEYVQVKEAAYKAACAAVEAKQKAAASRGCRMLAMVRQRRQQQDLLSDEPRWSFLHGRHFYRKCLDNN
ncbi:uncharacterized protein LOC115629849, partial [Scaptodrosophila lebanonensis]|uniref:Uncharacterized protein LOC115629849 n=1 Tax=Drosophila lebanonensis TaxID=7225 RepID=A0A6J2U334_DROLE